MVSEFLSYIFLLLGLVCITCIVVGWLIYRFRSYFTRELFLTVWILGIACWFLLIFGILMDPHTFVSTFPFLRGDYSALPEGTAASFLWTTVLGIILFVTIFQIHSDWDGKKSRLQYEEEIGDRKKEIAAVLQAIFFRDIALKPWTGIESDAVTPLLPNIISAEKPWHIHAVEILELLNPQFKIHIGKESDLGKNDWFPEEQCFISIYGKTPITVGIFCKIEEPSFGELEHFVQFVREQAGKGNPFKLIALIGKEEHLEREMIDFCGKIEFRYEGELVRALMAKFEFYRLGILRQYESNPIETGSNITIKDIFVQPSGKQLERDLVNQNKLEHPIESIEVYLKNWIHDESNSSKKQIALLGEYGQGKSVMSLRLAYTILKDTPNPVRMPIIFELRGTAPRSFRSQLEFLSVWAVNHDLRPKVILKLHELGRLLLIFEGFDEMDLVGNYEVRLNHFQRLWSFSTAKSKIIITGRPNFFLNDKELTTLLRTHQDLPELPFCEELHFEMFNIDQISKALRYKGNKEREEIIDLLKGSPENSGFRDLMKRPTLLFIAGLIWEKENLGQKGSQINSAFIMARFLEYCYKRQHDKLQRTPQHTFADSKPILEVAERAYFMMGIAIAMAKSKTYTNQIKQIDLNETVIKLINGFNLLITQNADQRFYRTSFQDRVQSFEAKKTVLRDVIACGVLVRDLSGEDVFKFGHKSFLEYLVGRFYVSLLLHSKKPSQNQIIAQTISKALNLDLLAIRHTPDTAKFTGELLVNEANISSLDYKANAKELFRFLYPVRILDSFPNIAFPSFQAFFFGVLTGGLAITFAAVLATLTIPFLGLIIETILFISLFLFGLRVWFRAGEFIGMLLVGFPVIFLLEDLSQIPFSEMSFQVLGLIEQIEASPESDTLGLIIVFLVMGIAFLIVKFFLIKSSSKNNWNLIAYENSQIDKILQLWVIACQGIGVPDKYLLKFMSKRKLKKLKDI